LQGAAALGAYEVGAIEYLYDSGMECAIVSGASSGAMNAATLAGARGYPPQLLRELWDMLTVKPPVPFLPPVIRQSWSMFGVPHMYRPRLDYWNLPNWTYFSDNTPLKGTLEDLLDWDQIRDPEHMRLIVSASGVEDGGTAYFSNLNPDQPLRPEHVLASGSFPGIPVDAGRGPRLLGRRADRQHPAQAGHRQPARRRAGDDAGHHDRCVLQLGAAAGQHPRGGVADVRDVPAEQAEGRQRHLPQLHPVHPGAQAGRRAAPGRRPGPQDQDWDEVMNYALVRQIRMIDMHKPTGESASDWSPEAVARRIRAGYDQTKAALEQTPLTA